MLGYWLFVKINNVERKRETKQKEKVNGNEAVAKSMQPSSEEDW